MSETETLETEKEARKLESARIRAVILETFVKDPERVAERRKQLESISLYDLRGEEGFAVSQLYERLRQHPHAVKVSRLDTYDERKITLPLAEESKSITIKAREDELIRIYTGEASKALGAESGSIRVFDAEAELLAISVSPGGTMGGIGMVIAQSSIKDMQARAENILALEVLTEKLTLDQSSPVAAQIGEAAVQSQVS